MGLSWVGPLKSTFFSTANTVVLHNTKLVESPDVERQVWRANYKLYVDFGLYQGSIPLTPASGTPNTHSHTPLKGQLYQTF